MFRQNYEESTIDVTVKITVPGGTWDGTDNNVYIQFGNTSRILLDDPNKNDFERNSTNTFTLKLTPSAANGPFSLRLEKTHTTFDSIILKDKFT
jgi:hypothetical protein